MNNNQRLISLDAFRGFTIAAMILVNFPGSWSHVYSPLLHAEWNGLTPTDLIFPFFLFIVGISIVLSFSRHLEEGYSKRRLIRRILIRALKIFAVGIGLNFIHHFQWDEIRYAGVLQRIAIVFLISSVIFLLTDWKGHLVILASLLIGYWLLMTLVPTPGFSKPMLEPGMNLAAWADERFLPGKLWHDTWDPEGLLSTIPAIGTCIMGMLTGLWIKREMNADRKLNFLFLFGILAATMGYLWSWIFPVNKNLWTSSYVLVCGGFAILVLAASYFVVDILQRKHLARIGVIFGANAITVYVLADLLSFLFYRLNLGDKSLAGWFVGLADASFLTHNFMSFVYALLFVALNFLPAYWLYKRKIFIRL